jgi:hypothetical protein
MLFEVAMIQVPVTKKEQDEGVKEKLLMPPTPVIADNDMNAAMEAFKKAKDILPEDTKGVKVLIRPFAPQSA